MSAASCTTTAWSSPRTGARCGCTTAPPGGCTSTRARPSESRERHPHAAGPLRGGLRAAAGAELHPDVLDVLLHGPRLDEQGEADVAVGAPVREEGEHLLLSRGERPDRVGHLPLRGTKARVVEGGAEMEGEGLRQRRVPRLERCGVALEEDPEH